MEIGTFVVLKHRHALRDGQLDLSNTVGRVCEKQVDDGQELNSVIFHEHGVLVPCVPVELLEVTVAH